MGFGCDVLIDEGRANAVDRHRSVRPNVVPWATTDPLITVLARQVMRTRCLVPVFDGLDRA